MVADDGCVPEMGVRTDIPFRDLTEKEKDIIYHGLAEAYQMTLRNLVKWVAGVPDSLPEEMRSKADGSLLWEPRSRLQKTKTALPGNIYA